MQQSDATPKTTTVQPAEPAPEANAAQQYERDLEQEKRLFRKRTIARGIDSFIVFLMGFPTGFCMFLWALQVEEQTGQPVTQTGPAVLFIVCALGTLAVFHHVWECFFLTWFAATPGKLLLGLRVVDLHTGGRPGLMQALHRAYSLHYLGLLWYFGYPALLPFGWFWARRRPIQPWDLASRTRVISVR